MVDLVEVEALDFARMASAAYQCAVAFYRTEGGRDPNEADALARTPAAYAVDAPSYEVSWLALNGLLDSDPATAAAIWQRVKRDAAGYVEGGTAIAEALGYSTPWERAQYLAVRQGFYEEWVPRGAVERTLLDTLAAAFCAHIHWLAQVQQRGTTDPRQRKGDAGWELPLQTTADALDQAAQMCDRFNRIMIRTLRALRDLRRYTVTINGDVGQLNVGDKQIITGGAP